MVLQAESQRGDVRSSVCFSALLGLRQLDKYCLLFGALSAELGGGGGCAWKMKIACLQL